MKTRWGVKSTRRFWIIIMVFSCTGIGILLLKDPLYGAVGVTVETSHWVKIPLVILFYQILLLLIGALFGEFRFFWEKEKKLGRLLLRPFRTS